MNKSSIQRKLNIYGMMLILLNGLNTGVEGLTNINVLKSLFRIINYNIYIVISVIIGLISAYLAYGRDTYLTFLSETVMPCSVLKNQTPKNATLSKKIKVPANTKVIFWASEPKNSKNTHLDSPQEAYNEYKNMGVTTSDANGIAILKVRKPRGYQVNRSFRKKILNPHIHYRFCKSHGMMSRIETVHV